MRGLSFCRDHSSLVSASMIDFAALLYAPIYKAFGVPATFTCLYGDRIELAVIDQTGGVEVADASSIDIKTIRPAVTIRLADLVEKGFDAADLEDSQLVLGDRVWWVKATMPKPAPTGEAEGELYLFLIEDAA
jgi:hypothetical protein